MGWIGGEGGGGDGFAEKSGSALIWVIIMSYLLMGNLVSRIT